MLARIFSFFFVHSRVWIVWNITAQYGLPRVDCWSNAYCTGALFLLFFFGWKYTVEILKHSYACVKLIEFKIYAIVAVSNGNIWYNACTSTQKSSRPWFFFLSKEILWFRLSFRKKKKKGIASIVSLRSCFFFLSFNVWNLINRQRRWSVLFKEREDGMKTKKK